MYETFNKRHENVGIIEKEKSVVFFLLQVNLLLEITYI